MTHCCWNKSLERSLVELRLFCFRHFSHYFNFALIVENSLILIFLQVKVTKFTTQNLFFSYSFKFVVE